MDLRRIDDRVSVAPQIAVGDIDAIKTAGFSAIINNRPDDEDMGQPSGAAIRDAATAAGLRYYEIPVTHSGFSHPQLDAMAAAIEEAGGPVLAYCRSGTRSCNLWALARAKSAGDDPTALSAKAAAAGYDLSSIRAMLDALAAGR